MRLVYLQEKTVWLRRASPTVAKGLCSAFHLHIFDLSVLRDELYQTFHYLLLPGPFGCHDLIGKASRLWRSMESVYLAGSKLSSRTWWSVFDSGRKDDDRKGHVEAITLPVQTRTHACRLSPQNADGIEMQLVRDWPSRHWVFVDLIDHIRPFAARALARIEGTAGPYSWDPTTFSISMKIHSRPCTMARPGPQVDTNNSADLTVRGLGT